MLTSIDYAKLRQDFARTLARICPRWLADQREDVVQAAVMRVMQFATKHSMDGEGDEALAPSYLYRIAYNALVDEIRRVRRRNETDLEGETVEPAAVPSACPERIAASRETGRCIQDCLARLARDRRLAVTLHLQGYSVPEAARMLDWALKRTENLVYRGLADLRACLISKGIRP